MIKTTKPPHQAKIHECFKRIDYSDSFSFQLPNPNLSIEEIYKEIFSSSPRWITGLLQLRNKLVSLAGLKTDASPWKNRKLVEGEKMGIFRIYSIHAEEIIAGEDDKHLDFRVSVFRMKQHVYVSTLVEYHNLFGRAYMTIVKPFHKLVVKSLLKSAVNKMNRKKLYSAYAN